MTAEHFFELLETIRLTTGMTQGEVAEILGVSDATITVWKSKGVPPKRAFVVGQILSDYFGG